MIREREVETILVSKGQVVGNDSERHLTGKNGLFVGDNINVERISTLDTRELSDTGRIAAALQFSGQIISLRSYDFHISRSKLP